MRDLVSDDHSYSAEVKGLVLMFAEERRLQDSCWKNLSEQKKNLQDKLVFLAAQQWSQRYDFPKMLICQKGLIVSN